MTATRDIRDAIAGKLVTNKRWIHPREALHLENASWITVDESLTRRTAQYSVIRFGGGDGTYDQELDLIARTFQPFGDRSTCFGKLPDLSETHDIHYTIGLARLATVLGLVELKCSTTHKYPGQHQSCCVPVITTWTLRA